MPLLDDAGLVIEPWVKAAAIVQDRDASFDHRSQVVDGEQIGHRGEIMRNFPLALTHFSPISAACNPYRYLDGGGSVDAGQVSRKPE